MGQVEIYFDGAANNHIHKATGKAPMGVGVVCYIDGNKRYENAFFAGYGNSMEAEWCGLIMAMKVAYLVSSELGGIVKPQITIYSDNEVVVKQWNGDYGVDKFEAYYKRAAVIFGKIRADCKVKVKWIPREQNEEADGLSKMARTEMESDFDTTKQFTFDFFHKNFGM